VSVGVTTQLPLALRYLWARSGGGGGRDRGPGAESTRSGGWTGTAPSRPAGDGCWPPYLLLGPPFARRRTLHLYGRTGRLCRSPAKASSRAPSLDSVSRVRAFPGS